MSDSLYFTKRLDHLGIVAGTCRQIDLIGQIDALVGPTERTVTVGEAVQAMVLNALGFGARALYLTPDFFQNKPVDLLIRPGLSASQFNDDSLGDALDRLYAAGVTEVFAHLAAHACRVVGIETAFYHLDTTAFSLYGDYDTPNQAGDGDPIQITYGHSKDSRPDLKQAMLSLIVTHEHSLPRWMEALSGNSSDKTSFPETIRAFTDQLAEEAPPFFVVDSALYAKESLLKLGACQWLTRVPATLTDVQTLYQEVTLEDMTLIPATQERYLEVGSTYGDVRQRWVLVYAPGRFARQSKTFEKKKARLLTKAEKAFKKVTGQAFECEADARATVERVSSRWSLHQVAYTVSSRAHYAGRGRPRKGQAPSSTSWHVAGTVVEDPAAVERARRPLGKFVLATNELSEAALPVERMLPVYRSQAATVERGFRFLKDPLFYAERFYLKKPERIMALLMVMCISLLVYALADRTLQEGMTEGKLIRDRQGRLVGQFSLRRVFQLFEGLDLLTIITPAGTKRQLLNFHPFHRDILKLFGQHVENIYDMERGYGM